MARGEFPSAKQDQFVLRFPDGMRDRIKELAEQNGRSMNAEIIAMMEAAQDGGSAEASRLKKLLDDERNAFRRTSDLIDQQMDMLHSYRDILKRASAEVVQHARVILSLCSIIETMDGPADDEILATVKRIRAAAELAKAHQESADERAGKEERRKLDAAIAKADDLLKDDED